MTYAGKSEAEVVNEIASELNLLSVTRDPEDFLVRRNDLVVRLRRLSRHLTREPDAGVRTTTYRTTPAKAGSTANIHRRSR